MAFDAARKRVLLFGGLLTTAGGRAGDTWEWDGELWTQVSDFGPSPRAFHAMAYDEVSQGVVLFGGARAAGDFLADTWGWDGAAWTQLADTGPSARAIPGMASDPQRKRIICFGGNSTLQISEPNMLGDTWEWDGTEWTECEHEGIGPSARQGCAMAYDFPGARTLLFGGLAGTDVANAMRDDTWAWDGVTWSQVAHTGPTRRFFHAMTAGPTSVVLFGGQHTNLGRDAETWEWVAGRWVQRADFGPPARHAHGIAFDSVRHRVVIFGGAGAAADTWEGVSP